MSFARYFITLLLCLCTSPALAEDWPQWLGPNSASEWEAEGIKTSFDAGELQPKWTSPCSYGYSGPVVADGRVYVFDYEVTKGTVENNPGRPIALEGRERLHCLDANTGKVVWTQGEEVDYYVSYPGGPRATPYVDGERIYTLGTEGDLICRRTSDGEKVWHVNFMDKFASKTPIWGHSSCPLVVGKLVFAMVGGEGSAIVAFDKMTGDVAWQALTSNQPGYAAPVAIDLDDKTCIAAFHPGGVSLLEATTGNELWTKSLSPRYGMSIAVPRVLGDEMFVTAYGEAMLVGGVGSGDPKTEWKTNAATEAVYCSNSSPYFSDGTVYGCDIESSKLIAIDAATGDRLWDDLEVVVGKDPGRRPRHGTAFIVRHTPSGKYFLFNELGELLVADLTRDGITVHSRAKIIEPVGEAFGRDVVWTHPAFADGCVFVRNDKQMACVNLKQ